MEIKAGDAYLIPAEMAGLMFKPEEPMTLLEVSIM